MPRFYNYKLTFNEKYWETQLLKINKVLTERDKKLLKAVRREKSNNESLKTIQGYAQIHGLCIPSLTEDSGDCLFESLEKTGFFKDRQILRKSVALLFFLFGNCKVIPTNPLTLKEIFEASNDIEYVYCYKRKRLYKYTYYTMCSDMYTNGSWSRLPTDIVLQVISIFYKVRIKILHDNNNITTIRDKTYDDDMLKNFKVSSKLRRELTQNEIDTVLNKYTINVALIGESHYVPLVKKIINECKLVQNTTEHKKFLKWAQSKSDLIGLYIDEDSESDSSEEFDETKDNETKTDDFFEECKQDTNSTKKQDKKSLITSNSSKSLTLKQIKKAKITENKDKHIVLDNDMILFY